MRGAAAGAALPAQALAFLRRNRSLWRLVAVPFLLSALALAGTLALVVGFAGEIHGSVTGWLPELRADRMVEWLWVGPARVLVAALGALLFALVALLALLAAFLVANLAAAPFHDELSKRVEERVAGRAPEPGEGGLLGLLREGGRALREEAQRVVFFVSVSAAIALLGLLVPGGQILAPPALVLFAVAFLPLDYAGFALDRRRLPFAARRRWLRAHAAETLGFGAAAFAVCAVPGLNLLAMPVLVVAGTLLTLRHPPEEDGLAPPGLTAPPGGGPSGSAPSP